MTILRAFSVIYLFAAVAAWSNEESNKYMIDNKVKTHCVGNFLFEAPSEFRMRATSNYISGAIKSFSVEDLGLMAKDELDERIRNRIADITKKPGILQRQGRIHLQQRRGASYMIGWDEVYEDEMHTVSDRIKVEIYATRGERAFMIDGILQPNPPSASDISRLFDVTDHVSENIDNTGFCIGNLTYVGMVSGANVDVVLYDPRDPKYYVEISILELAPGRQHEISGFINLFRRRRVAGYPGEQVMLHDDTDDPDMLRISFGYQGGREPTKSEKGIEIMVGLTKHGQQDGTRPYGLRESEEIWDMILNSMRGKN